MIGIGLVQLKKMKTLHPYFSKLAIVLIAMLVAVATQAQIGGVVRNDHFGLAVGYAHISLVPSTISDTYLVTESNTSCPSAAIRLFWRHNFSRQLSLQVEYQYSGFDYRYHRTYMASTINGAQVYDYKHYDNVSVTMGSIPISVQWGNDWYSVGIGGAIAINTIKSSNIKGSNELYAVEFSNGSTVNYSRSVPEYDKVSFGLFADASVRYDWVGVGVRFTQSLFPTLGMKNMLSAYVFVMY